MGIEARNRALLVRLHRAASGPVSAADAASLLELDPPRARRLLAYLAARGWLARIRPGLYALVPLGAPEPSQWREDPWVIAAKTFAPCYIGGWSACEHWGLTEQVFRDVVIVTGRPVRRQRVEIQGNPFRLKALPSTKQFGTRQVWRGRVRVLVSDPARTVVDILDDPAIGGGIRHAASVIKAYLESEHRDDALLLEHARRRGNRAVFKRLGHIVEVLGIPAQGIQDACKASKSLGLALLDPRVPAKGRIVKRWSLRVNVELPRGGTSA